MSHRYLEKKEVVRYSGTFRNGFVFKNIKSTFNSGTQKFRNNQ